MQPLPLIFGALIRRTLELPFVQHDVCSKPPGHREHEMPPSPSDILVDRQDVVCERG